MKRVLPISLLVACSGVEEVKPPVEEVSPAALPCVVAARGELDELPIAWVDGSTPQHAAWQVDGAWGTDHGVVPISGRRAWVVHDELWMVDGMRLQRLDLDADGAQHVLELEDLLSLDAPYKVVDLSVVGVGGLVEGVWLALTSAGEAEGSFLVQLVPDAPTAGWVVASRYPDKGLDPVRYTRVEASPSRVAVAFGEVDGAKVRVVSRRGKPLRTVTLPRAGDGEGPSAIGLLGQGVLAVMPDGRVVVDRPGHRHGEVVAGLHQLALGSEGLIGVTGKGRLRTRVREGVSLTDGLSHDGLVWGAATLGEGAVVVGPSQPFVGLDVLRGPIQPPTSGPTWAPEVAPPHRCAVPDLGQPALPPLLGIDGSVRLVFPPPATPEGEPPASPHWMQLAPPSDPAP